MLASVLCTQTVWAGNPSVTTSPAALGLTFNTAACNAGQQVITGNAASHITDSGGYTGTYELQFSAPGDTAVLGTYNTTNTTPVPITLNSLVHNNSVGHTTGQTLQVRLVCTTGAACTNAGQVINGITIHNALIANMNYACPVVPVSAPFGDNGFLVLLASSLGLMGTWLIFKKEKTA
jgi:hypothetical protein